MTAPVESLGTPNALVSVVVCTRNRAQKLSRCLSALCDQSLGLAKFEVVVVDDSSTDATAAVARRFPVRLVQNAENLGYAVARNVGVSAAGAPIVAFTDDDCIPARSWLEQLLSGLDDPDVVAVGGKIEPFRVDSLLLRYYELNNPLAHNPHVPTPTGGIWERFVAYLRTSFHLRSLPDHEVPLFTIASANMAVRRAALDFVGGFDPRLHMGGEDEDLSMRLRRSFPGRVLSYNPRAVVAHDYDPSLRDALRRSRAYGYAAGFSYLHLGGRSPAIYPFPILVLLSFSLALLDPILLVVSFVLPIMLYPGWLRAAAARRRPTYAAYALLQTVLELQTTIGFLRCLIAARRLRPATEQPR